MAIVINSLTPINPIALAGGTVTFAVNAEETQGGTLSYEWQFSSDAGGTYTANGLFNNTDDTFTTSALTQNQSGYYFRVKITSSLNEIVYSNEVQDIGNRILVVQAAPSIVVLDEYNPSYTVPVGVDIQLQVESTLFNVDTSTASSMDGLSIQWQQSIDDGDNWTNVVDNMPGATGNFKYDIVEEVYQAFSTPAVIYAKRSTLTLGSITFNSNLYQYRARITRTGASNSPTIVPATLILINPTISIVQQPGVNANDTSDPVQCYKTSISGSGTIRSSVSAFTTSGNSLAYSWEYAVVDYNGDMTEWLSIQDGIDRYWFRYKTGTNGSTDVLELQRTIYFEQLLLRAVISGNSGETDVTSDPHYIYMKDVEVLPENVTDKESLEDFYDPAVVPNSERFLYTDYSIQNVLFDSYINVGRNSGLNGKVLAEFQRQDPGSSTWEDLDVIAEYVPVYDDYTATPTNDFEPIDISYLTPPLRIDLDNGAKYRIKITSTAVYTLSGNTKTLTEFYSNVANLTVYRGIYITSQPNDAFVYNNQSAAFSIAAVTTSPATLSYQWQEASLPTLPWSNISNGGAYSGATTSLLVISPATTSIVKRYFRCVVSAPGILAGSAPSSNNARLIINVDSFTNIGTLNDYSVDQFEPVSWTVEAQTLSLGTITYQWQKSTDFNSLNPSAATWGNITGQTTNTYSINSVIASTDQAYYRCKLTSLGGQEVFTNAAFLSVNIVEIKILENIPTTRTFLEGIENEYNFSIDAIATKGDQPTYQWQIKRVGETSFTDFGLGYNNQQSINNNYTPRAFDAVTDNGAVIRCKLNATEIPDTVYSNECTITVNRRFYYFADSATKNAPIGGSFSLDLRPISTGGTPSFQWQRSTNNGSTWSNISGETSSELTIINVTSGLNGYLYRCQVTLANCTQYQYSRNNTTFVVSASSTGFTESVKLNAVTAVIKPQIYSKQIEKTGAAIGSVICVPKPAGYVNDTSATTDDISLWKVSQTGDISSSGTVSSTIISGTTYNLNKPSWVTDSNYKTPKWLFTDDRFPGFIELRGQWILKADFPILYKVLGGSYGETSTLFRLPNPYGKKVMGTGNVNNNGGNASIVPLFNADGTSGGDKNEAGSIGGVWNYSKSAQLPPGSPGVSGQPDGTAGVDTAATFSLGNFTTDGFLECEGVASTNFSGSFTFTVGPLIEINFAGVPPHSHFAISVGAVEGYRADSNGCSGGSGSVGTIDPPFYGISAEGGTIASGPAGIADNDRGVPHSHGLSLTAATAGNGSANNGVGIGDTTASTSVTMTSNIHFQSGVSTPSANVFLEPAPITLTNASKPVFNSSLQFYLKNNEELPVNSNYFRLKYMIKAY